MKLDKLKKIYDKEYGFDIYRQDRKRYKVYARKVFALTGKRLGFTLDRIGEAINVKHDNVLSYIKTHHTINQVDKKIYNKIVLKHKLNIKLFDEEVNTMIESRRQTQNEAILNKFNELSQLSDSEIKEFEETRLKPFLLMLKSRRKQKEIKNVVGARLLR